MDGELRPPASCEGPIIASPTRSPRAPLAAFVRATDLPTAEATSRLLAERVSFRACVHTLRAVALAPAAFLEGFVVAERGVVELSALQSEGWAYLKP